MSRVSGRSKTKRRAPRDMGVAQVAWEVWGSQFMVVVVLRHCRALWAELTETLNATTLCRALLHGARYFEGSPRRWWLEYPDCWVVHQDRETLQWRFEWPLPLLERHLSTQLGVWNPRNRGLAESALHYLAWRFVMEHGRRQRSHDNQTLRMFLDATAQRRPHPSRRGRTIAEVLAEERRHLRVLPETLEALETMLIKDAH